MADEPPTVPPTRRYVSYISDSDRWQALDRRDDDIIISTPSKCGTTWTQQIVAMLVFGTADLPAPLSELSPWLDMQIRTTDEVVAALDAQQHRRFIKTHTPLDGLPDDPRVTYLTVFRHPLDVALSDLDHARNTDGEIFRLRQDAVGDKDLDQIEERPPRPDDPAEHLRRFIDSDVSPNGSGPHSLRDFCEQLAVAWDRRHRPNVHLFHYDDLWADLDGQMRRMAAALGVEPDEGTWPDLVAAATLDAMRGQADRVAPDAGRGIWQSNAGFFRQGGRRNWAELLTPAELAHFDARLDHLAGPAAADWIRHAGPIP